MRTAGRKREKRSIRRRESEKRRELPIGQPKLYIKPRRLSSATTVCTISLTCLAS